MAATGEPPTEYFIVPRCPLRGSVADGCSWPGTEISAADLLAEKLPFNSVEREEFRCNSQRQVVADVVEKPGGRAAASREQGCFSRIFVLIGSGEAVFLGYFTQFHVRRAQYSRQ